MTFGKTIFTCLTLTIAGGCATHEDDTLIVTRESASEDQFPADADGVDLIDLVFSELEDGTGKDSLPPDLDLILDLPLEIPCPTGPQPTHVRVFGGEYAEEVTAMVGAENGALLTAISSSSQEFYAGSEKLLVAGCTDHEQCQDAVIVNISGSGELVWAVRIGGPGRETVNALAVDSDGTIYVGGQFSSPVLKVGATELSCSGQQDGFVARLSGDGEVLDGFRIGGEGADAVSVLAMGAADNLFVGGWFRSAEMSWDGQLLSVADDNCVLLECGDLFLAQVQSDGNLVWLNRYGGIQGERFVTLATGTDGTLFAGGYHGSWEIDFGGGPLMLGETICGPMFGCADGFVAHFDEAGAHLHSKGFGGDLLDYLRGLAVTAGEELLVTGVFTSSDIDFGGGPLTNIGDEEGFAAALTPQLGHLWSVSCDAEPLAIVPALQGTATLAGRLQPYHKGLDACTLQRPGKDDAFVARLGETGSLVWTTVLGGSENDRAVRAVMHDGSSWIAGNFSSSDFVILDKALENHGGQEVFVLEIPP